MNAYLVLLTPIIVSLFGIPQLDLLFKANVPSHGVQYSFRLEVVIHKNNVVYFTNKKWITVTPNNEQILMKFTLNPALTDGVYNVTTRVYDSHNNLLFNQTYELIVKTFKWIKTFHSQENQTMRFSIIYETNGNITLPIYISIEDNYKNITTQYKTISDNGIGSVVFYIPKLPHNGMYTYYVYSTNGNRTIIFDSGNFYYGTNMYAEEIRAKNYFTSFKIVASTILLFLAISVFISIFKFRPVKSRIR